MEGDDPGYNWIGGKLFYSLGGTHKAETLTVQVAFEVWTKWRLVCVCKLGAKSAATKPTEKRLCLASLALPVTKDALLGRSLSQYAAIYPKTHTRAPIFKSLNKMHFWVGFLVNMPIYPKTQARAHIFKSLNEMRFWVGFSWSTCRSTQKRMHALLSLRVFIRCAFG